MGERMSSNQEGSNNTENQSKIKLPTDTLTDDWMSYNVGHMSDSEEEANVPTVKRNIEIEQKKIEKKEESMASNQEGSNNTENQFKIKLPTDTLTDDWMSDNVGHMSDSEEEASVLTVTENIEIEQKIIEKKEERMSSNQGDSNNNENQSKIKLPTDTL